MEYPQYDYAVIGGDMRQVYLTEQLSQESRVTHYGLANVPDIHRCNDFLPIEASSLDEAVGSSRCIVCPIPFSKNGIHLNQNILKENIPITTLLDNLKPGQLFFGGCIPDDFKRTATEKNIFIYDLMEDFALATYNTLATAEGAICEAIIRSPLNLHQSQCAVLGYGKCGRTLVNYLKGMSGYVYTYSSQPEELAVASTISDKTGNLKDFHKCAEKFDFVFNTIPAKILTDDVLNKLKNTVTIIDIASAPGGVDYEKAHQLGLTAALCPGLPGKYAPASSAAAIKKAIETYSKGVI